jgi:hydrogenase-4 component B
MVALGLVLLGAALWLGAGFASLMRQSAKLSLPLSLLGSALGMFGAISCLVLGGDGAWDFPFIGFPARFALDALSAAFLLPLYLVAGLGVVYGSAYWPLDATKGAGRSLRFFYALLVAAMNLVFIARQGILFLLVWEAMAVSAFFLIGTEHEDAKVRRASWVYLAATHAGTVVLTAMVILLARRGGGLLWLPLTGDATPRTDIAILILACVGFAFKAGWIPFHFWLPAAHAGAPSHVSAILSAVMLKAGIYGVLRISGLLPSIPGGVGGILLILGAATALYGVLYALAERDFKRLLAYSSIENLGVIAMGIGLGLTGRAAHDPWLTALGFGSALLHVWNHAVFKSLLFFGAGAVLHATGTRDMELLGGLAARMPRTTLALFPGMLAVAALPPFGAFISEWVLYHGLFVALIRGYAWSAGFALPALALVGGLAGVAFAKFFGFLFLGSPRGPLAEKAHDPPLAMGIPMGVLAFLSLAMGVGSVWLLPLLDRIVAILAPGVTGLLVPGLGIELEILGGCLLLLLVLAAGFRAWARRPARIPNPAAPPTWDCGYAAPTVRMQYSADSFADGWAMLLPGRRTRMRRLKNIFPGAASLHTELRDSLGLGFLEPQIERFTATALRLRRLQPGFLSIYILYVLLALVGVFLWMLIRQGLRG